ncbi:uncharacterized protein FIBRA_03291 [Fibroporia radiculosa]|uniref:DUF6533 domain-containing protein n=1 Tax=Fibroporia radiculosa TaxID=599839 RepID=J4HVW9_9APHY|nr:uncharacterized protein FIBRA_03291 [Fibroporia radiculosa]CCM01242.1 predicted protein [Fibroporia radiculosa]
MNTSFPSPEALPNPYTPLVWLSPRVADDYQASLYLYVAVFSAFTWDWMTSWSKEYRLIFKEKFRLTTLTYCLSRLGAFVYLLLYVILGLVTVDDCQKLQVASGCFFIVAVTFTAALFLFRIYAVFERSKPVIAFFGFLWFANVCASFVIPFAMQSSHVGESRRCITTGVEMYSSSVIIICTVNDTLVFLGISSQLLSASFPEESWSKRLRSFASGRGLPRLSRSLLQSGQLFYFVTVGINIITMATLLSTNLPPSLAAMFTPPNIALENAMATRVFREVKFGAITEHPMSLHSSEGSAGYRGAAMSPRIPARAYLMGSRGSRVEDLYSLEARAYGPESTADDSIVTIGIDQKRVASFSDSFSDSKQEKAGDVLAIA